MSKRLGYRCPKAHASARDRRRRGPSWSKTERSRKSSPSSLLCARANRTRAARVRFFSPARRGEVHHTHHGEINLACKPGRSIFQSKRGCINLRCSLDKFDVGLFFRVDVTIGHFLCRRSVRSPCFAPNRSAVFGRFDHGERCAPFATNMATPHSLSSKLYRIAPDWSVREATTIQKVPWRRFWKDTTTVSFARPLQRDGDHPNLLCTAPSLFQRLASLV